MKILALFGSSRRNGNSEILTEKVLEGIDYTPVYLAEHSIHPIEDKRHTAEGFSPVNDDYDAIIQQVLSHDILIFVTPVYWFGMSGQMKTFIDRWSQSLRDKRFDFKAEMRKKKAYVIVTGGDDPKVEALPLIQQFKLIFDYMPMPFIDYVIGKGNKPGDVLQDPAALSKVSLLNQNLKSV